MNQLLFFAAVIVAVAIGVHYAAVIAPRALVIAKQAGICLAGSTSVVALVGVQYAVATTLNDNEALLRVSLMFTAIALAYGVFWWNWLDKGKSQRQVEPRWRAVCSVFALIAFAFSAAIVLQSVAQQAKWAAAYDAPPPVSTPLGGGWRTAPIIEPAHRSMEQKFAAWLGNTIKHARDGVQYAATHPVGTLGAVWKALTWGELAGIVVYLLGMRVFAELHLEYRAQMAKLPRYMVRMLSSDWPALIFWPLIAVVLTACDVVGYRENKENVQRFVDAQMQLERAERHPYFK